jgi:Holliday junction resolvase RusA-like endonuclease
MLVAEFDIIGQPEPQPRPKGRLMGKGPKAFIKIYTPSTADKWKTCVRSATRRHLGENAFLEGPLELHLMFRIKRPEGHFVKAGLRSTAPTWHTNEKADVDNLAKAVMDAMTNAGAWKGDGRVCVLDARKRYVNPGEVQGCKVRIVRATEGAAVDSLFSQEAVR